MSRKTRVPLGARLRRSRALSVALGERRFYVHPLDLPRGRPSFKVQVYLDRWKTPYRLSDSDPDSAAFSECAQSLIMDDCCSFLHSMGMTSGWFEITERARILGTNVFLRVRDFDLLCTTCDLFARSLDGGIWATDGSGQLCKRRFVPIVKGA